MRILAIDPARYLGWAHGEPGGTPIYGTHRLPAGKYSRRALALEGLLIDLIKGSGIEKVYAEEPLMRRANSFKALISTAGLASMIGVTCERLGIDLVYVPQQTWRSQFGIPTQAPRKIKNADERRKWMKAQCIARCEKLGYAPQDDNAADALGLWHSRAQAILDRAAAPSLFETDLMADLEV